MLPYKKHLKTLAQKLRLAMTDAERKLWQGLRGQQLGATFNRQKPIGPYVVDFYCAAAKLVVEVDGSQHLEGAGQQSDHERDMLLIGLGLKVLRFDNRQVLLETQAVLEEIRLVVVAATVKAEAKENPPSPLLRRGS